MRAAAPRIVSSVALLVWVAAALPLSTGLQSLPTTTTSAPRPPRATTTTSSSFEIRSGTWKFREQEHPIAYEYVVCGGSDGDASASSRTSAGAAPVLLLNGFGMGTFHQHRLMRALHDQQQQQLQQQQEDGISDSSWRSGGTVYAMDYLGQGRSWPRDCNDGRADSERGLRYCGNTWVEQILQFVEQEILASQQQSQQSPKVHLVGNSVGGHLAVFCAAARPDLVETVTLLNATPVWGLNLPFWSGHLPAPPLSRWAGRALFDAMRHPDTIAQFLDTTYVNGPAVWQPLAPRVRASTEGPGGHAAFASILWSPPVTVPLQRGSKDDKDDSNSNNGDSAAAEEASFYDCLEHGVQCDVLLCFGRDDPWCKPAFAKRMLQRLQSRQQQSSPTPPTQRYVELSNTGHCPNHESPTATARILAAWLGAASGRRSPEQLSLLPSGASSVVVREEWGDTVVRELEADEIPLSWADRLAVQFL